MIDYFPTVQSEVVKILFIGKKGDSFAEQAAQYTLQLFPNTLIEWGQRGVPLPASVSSWRGDYVFSYLSPWIIPERTLNAASRGGINWHPGPPDYPGIGCTNFAIYNGASMFGMTCHYMKPVVDSGDIIEVARFNVLDSDTVLSITQKCYIHISASYYGILEKIYLGESLPISNESWSKKPYTRKELNALCVVDPAMDAEEIQRRVKATQYVEHWAYVELGGIRFYPR